jgi:hypothetical protein
MTAGMRPTAEKPKICTTSPPEGTSEISEDANLGPNDHRGDDALSWRNLKEDAGRACVARADAHASNQNGGDPRKRRGRSSGQTQSHRHEGHRSDHHRQRPEAACEHRRACDDDRHPNVERSDFRLHQTDSKVQWQHAFDDAEGEHREQEEAEAAQNPGTPRTVRSGRKTLRCSGGGTARASRRAATARTV